MVIHDMSSFWTLWNFSDNCDIYRGLAGGRPGGPLATEGIVGAGGGVHTRGQLRQRGGGGHQRGEEEADTGEHGAEVRHEAVSITPLQVTITPSPTVIC